MIEKLEKAFSNLPDNSIHHFGYDYTVDHRDGHIYTIIKAEGKTYIVDGQEKLGINHSLDDIIPRIDFYSKVEMSRVDNLAFSDEYINFFLSMKKKK